MNIAQHYSIKAELDIVVHVEELLDEQNRQRVKYFMLKATGIERVHFNTEEKHLLVIGYDPAKITSSRILKLIKKQQIYAQPFGWI